jgi:hypothetical protein
MKVVGLSPLRTGCLYSPGNSPGTHFCQRFDSTKFTYIRGLLCLHYSLKHVNSTAAIPLELSNILDVIHVLAANVHKIRSIWIEHIFGNFPLFFLPCKECVFNLISFLLFLRSLFLSFTNRVWSLRGKPLQFQKRSMISKPVIFNYCHFTSVPYSIFFLREIFLE